MTLSLCFVSMFFFSFPLSLVLLVSDSVRLFVSLCLSLTLSRLYLFSSICFRVSLSCVSASPFQCFRVFCTRVSLSPCFLSPCFHFYPCFSTPHPPCVSLSALARLLTDVSTSFHPHKRTSSKRLASCSSATLPTSSNTLAAIFTRRTYG